MYNAELLYLSMREANAPMFSLIVLNYNGEELFRECLASIAAQTDRDFELLVVDNGSTVPWRSFLPESIKDRTVVIENGANLGYAEGNNRGILKARGEWIILINNDASLSPDFLREAKSATLQNPAYRMFAPQILVSDSPEMIDSAGVGIYLDGTARCRGWQEDRKKYQQPAEILGPVGSVGLYHKDIFDRAGLLDEDFFCYLEDSDLLLRAQWLGFKGLYWPALKAFHSKSTTMGRATPLKAFLVERNRIWCAIKNLPVPLVLAGPFLTLSRYLFQAVAAGIDQGIAGRFVRTYSWFELPKILFKSYWQALRLLPRMFAKRKRIMKTKTMSQWDYLRLLWKFRLTWRDFALKE